MPAQNRVKVPIGTVLEGKYRITSELGRGGMATVYEAVNIDIRKHVAVKILAAELVTSRIVRERFIREARAAAAIRSPYICDVYDSGMYQERPFLVMELLEGESLYDRMTRVRRIDEETTVRVMTLTARGLGKAHEAGVVHRDMKPENIFLIKGEEGETTVKIVDFGLAKFYEQPSTDASHVRLTREGALFGTPAYMSPEQAKGQGEVDHRADLWALGCITYECLTGRTVWKVDQGVAMILAQIAGAPLPKPSQLRKDLPQAFDRWFFKALDRDINKRFQNARELSEALEETLGPVSVPRSVPPPPSGRAAAGGAQAQLEAAPVSGPPAEPAQQPAPPSGRPSAPEEAEELTLTPALPSVEPGPRPTARSRSLQAITTLLVAAISVLTGYGLWLYVLNPPEPQPETIDAGTADAKPATSAKPKPKPLERESYALQLGAAQEWLTKGRMDNAVKMFREAFKNGGTGVSRALLSHAAVAQKAEQNRCKVTGLGRPRPFDVTAPSSRPTLALTAAGTVAVWADDHQESKKRRAVSTLLDSALRRIGPALVITPEVSRARYPQLIPAGDKLALLYGVRAGADPGAYVRLLAADGHIAGNAQRLTGTTRHRVNPTLAPTPSDSYWAAWEEQLESGTRDLMVRHLNAELKPISDAVRLTSYKPVKGTTVAVATPAAAVAHGHLHVLFVLEKARKTQVFLQRIALTDPTLKTGLVAAEDDDEKKKRKAERVDQFVGTVQPISTTEGKNAQPRIACHNEECFTVWDDERGGALAAFIDGEKGEKLWHREFVERGSRPNVAVSEAGAVVVWYESSRVKLASINRDGLGEESVLARVTGYQPHPSIAAGPKPGQWYIAWRDYEAGHLETFVVRTQCP